MLPMPAEPWPTGTLIVHPPLAVAEGGVAWYARISSADQQADLERQMARLAALWRQFGQERIFNTHCPVQNTGFNFLKVISLTCKAPGYFLEDPQPNRSDRGSAHRIR